MIFITLIYYHYIKRYLFHNYYLTALLSLHRHPLTPNRPWNHCTWAVVKEQGIAMEGSSDWWWWMWTYHYQMGEGADHPFHCLRHTWFGEHLLLQKMTERVWAVVTRLPRRHHTFHLILGTNTTATRLDPPEIEISWAMINHCMSYCMKTHLLCYLRLCCCSRCLPYSPTTSPYHWCCCSLLVTAKGQIVDR